MPNSGISSTGKTPRARLVGHFSTVGDVEVLRQTERQLKAPTIDYDVPPHTDTRLSVDSSWLDRFTLDPARYTLLIVVCGPFTRAMAARHNSIFGRFRHCVHIGVNLTMVEALRGSIRSKSCWSGTATGPCVRI